MTTMTMHFLAVLRANADAWQEAEIDFATFTACRQDTWEKIRRSGAEIEAQVLRVLRDQLPTSETAVKKITREEEDRQKDVAIAAIARQHLQIDTLELRHDDSFDFHEVHVLSARSALEAAYCAGIASRDNQREGGAPSGRPSPNMTERTLFVRGMRRARLDRK